MRLRLPVLAVSCVLVILVLAISSRPENVSSGETQMVSSVFDTTGLGDTPVKSFPQSEISSRPSFPGGDDWIQAWFPCLVGFLVLQSILVFILIRSMILRHQAERELERSRRGIFKILDRMPIMLHAFDHQGRVAIWNRHCEQVTGYPAEEVLGRDDYEELLRVESSPGSGPGMRWTLDGGEFTNMELSLTTKDGNVKTVIMSNITRRLALPGRVNWAIGLDITDRKRMEDLLRRTMEEYEFIFDNSVFGVMLVSKDRIIAKCNQAVARILGYDGPEDLEGQSVKMIYLSEEEFLSSGRVIGEIKQKCGDIEVTYSLRHRSGRPIWCNLYGKQLNRSLKTVDKGGVLWMFEDVTSRKKAEEELAALNNHLGLLVGERTRDLERKAEELRAANRQLVEMDKMKSIFLSSASHELRTPLTSLLGFAKLIRKDFIKHFKPLSSDDSKAAKAERLLGGLDVITGEGRRLTRLINDILDLKRIESGKMSWRDERVNLADIIEQAAAAIRGRIGGIEGLSFRVEVEKGLPEVMLDPDRMAQILGNLLNNAAKFTKSGEIALEAGMGETGTVRVSVRDTGAGIAENEIDKIFDIFHQARQEGQKPEEQQGSGLGLAICRQIVEHYNGKLMVESTLGRGSVFTVELPISPRPGDDAKRISDGV